MEVRLRKPKAIVMDIEGTTTSITFVSELLIPFIRKHLKRYLTENWGKNELMVTIDRLRSEAQAEHCKGSKVPTIHEDDDPEQVIKSVIANVLWQMDEKKKSTALQELQLLVWVFGYEQKLIQGHVFDDVAPALKLWKNDLKIKLYVYSTGMVMVQQLLLTCSNHGNLTSLIDDYFDHLLGPKVSPSSYNKIASLIEESESDILFLTDNPKEAIAALQAGFNAIIVLRPKNKTIPENYLKIFNYVDSFLNIIFEE